MKFITRYKSQGIKYGSYIIANSMQIAEVMAERRGLGEVIEGESDNTETLPTYSDLTDQQFIEQLPAVLHTAIFISNVALRAGTISIDEVLGDHGVVHELSHLLSPPFCRGKAAIKNARRLFDRLRESAIGFY